jgi:hypothetical protein
MEGRLLELSVLTVAEVQQRGGDEIGQLCGLKLGKLSNLLNLLKLPTLLQPLTL